MTMHFNEIILGLFVINLAMASGAGLYESRIVIPMWFHGSVVDTEAIKSTDVGRKFWGWVTTIPLTLLTIINIVEALGSEGPLRKWWLAATALILLERTGTFGFFIPTIIRLGKPDLWPESYTLSVANGWMKLNKVRIGLNLAGLLASMVAYTLLIYSTR